MPRARTRPRLGLILHGITYSYQERILRGADAECRRQGADLICFSGGSITDDEVNNVSYDIITPGMVDGMLVALGTMGTAAGSAEFEVFKQRFGDVPTCSLGYHYPEAISVLVDGSSTVETITRHLVEVHGRRRIAFIQGNSQESVQRQDAYERALVSCGLTVDPSLIFPGNYHGDAGVRAVEQLMVGGVCRADAIVAANDWMALGAMSALDKYGVRVPRDVAVVGFDDVDHARFEMPSLTTIRQPIDELGSHGVKAVLAVHRDEPVERVIVLPTEVQLRKSCGCYSGSQLHHSLRAAPLEGPPHSEGSARRRRSTALSSVAPDFGEALDETWSERLTQALDIDLNDPDGHELERTLESFITSTSSLGNVTAWHHVVSTLRRQTEANLTEAAALRRASRLFDAAQVLVSAHAERVQGKRRLAKEALLQDLTQLSEGLRAASRYDEIAATLEQRLAGLRVPSCLVTTHQGKLGPGTESRVIVAYEAERGLVDVTSSRMFARDLLPPELVPQRRATWIASVASFKREVLGYTMLEVSDVEAARYDSIREQIGIALNAVHMLNAFMEEVTKRERAERERLESEIALATRIQTGILPRLQHVEGLQIGSLMQPATEVGGDYFDVLPTRDGAWLAIGDVAGHGLPTGLVMLMIQSIVAAVTAGQPDAEPATVWTRLNAVLYENVRNRLQQDEHATLTVLRYSPDGRLEFAGAHEDIVVCRAATGRIETVPTPGIWAGITAELSDQAVENNHLQLEPGDLMVLYTDGIIEAQDERGEMFGLERLCEQVSRLRDRPVDEIVAGLAAGAKQWMVEQRDDLTLLAARYTG